MTTVSHHATTSRALACVKAWEVRHAGHRGKTPRHDKKITLYLETQHFVDAIRAEAKVRNMSVNSFMRAMIRGYFAAALHGR